ncbi:MFS domain-containing protein [Mycena sanguinolenta]|uniref:MFS domain-containing protein n=1 Tax=Mycena sanguinolenta TaxID=230812 RepID=A0A8H6XMC6_9AGAR|nr:MFS domain-containing protein [Mycena sanguinolenta]
MTIFFAPLRLPPPPPQRPEPLLTQLLSLTALQWAFFWVGWLAWTCDAIDFFSVSLSVSSLATQFGKGTTDIWPLVFNLVLIAVLELGAGFVQTFHQFLAVRSLFGIAMGGIWGLATSNALENLPVGLRGLASGVLQQGYAVGYLRGGRARREPRAHTAMRRIMPRVTHLFSAPPLPFEFLRGRSALLFCSGAGFARCWVVVCFLPPSLPPMLRATLFLHLVSQLSACISLKLVPAVHPGWRALFWTASGISLFGGFLRAILPESTFFVKARKAAESHNIVSEKEKTRVFIKQIRQMLKEHWALCVYTVLLMTGMNFLSHGSQDLYPTYMEQTKGFDAHLATIATIIGNCGAVAGGAFAGWISQFLGRRITIIGCVLLVAVFIPLWIIPSSFSSLAAGAFCVQFGVQGAWGVIPIHLAEIAPPAFRATFPGVTFQIGNMVSSASAQIESTGGDHLKTTVNGVVVPDYAKVQGILIGVVAAFVLLMIIVVPENHGSHFEKHPAAFDEGGEGDDAYLDQDSEKGTEERSSKENVAAAESA